MEPAIHWTSWAHPLVTSRGFWRRGMPWLSRLHWGFWNLCGPHLIAEVKASALHGDTLRVLVWGKMSSLDAIYMQVRLSEARAAGGCALKFSVLCRSTRGKLTSNGFGGRSWHEMESRVSAMRRAGRWVKSYLKAEQIAEKEDPIRDSMLFSSLTNTNTSAVDPSEVSTSHLARNNWFALIN